MFHQYYKNNFNELYRHVDISPQKYIDLKEWVECDHDDPIAKKKIKRVKDQVKLRPMTSAKFLDASPFILDDKGDAIRNF